MGTADEHEVPMTVLEKINFFFAPPLPMQADGLVSPLHLARRESQSCFLDDVIPEDRLSDNQRPPRRLFATMMVLMAGIDLLAKFHAGSDDIGKVGDRMKAFVSTFLFAGDPRAVEFADVLYIGCRNPLLHSFTLHQKKYLVALVLRGGTLAIWRTRGNPEVYMIDVEGLFHAFFKAVAAYEAVLRIDPDLQQNFEKMFESYGTLGFAGGESK
jgi:hypothetical protein